MKTRLIAFLVHSSISIAVAIFVIFIVFFLWYPAHLYEAMGVTHIFLILLVVDVVIGPVITFVIYDPKKKYLFFDLLIIALLQITALGYGLNTIFQSRPVFVVFSVDRFETVVTIDIDPKSMQKALSEGNKLASISWFKPHWVGASASPDMARQQEILFSSLEGGPDWPQLPELYTPLKKLKLQLIKKAKFLKDIRVLHNNSSDIENKLKKYDDNDVKWLPLMSKSKNMLVLIDAHSAEVIEIIDINPWP